MYTWDTCNSMNHRDALQKCYPSVYYCPFHCVHFVLHEAVIAWCEASAEVRGQCRNSWPKSSQARTIGVSSASEKPKAPNIVVIDFIVSTQDRWFLPIVPPTPQHSLDRGGPVTSFVSRGTPDQVPGHNFHLFLCEENAAPSRSFRQTVGWDCFWRTWHSSRKSWWKGWPNAQPDGVWVMNLHVFRGMPPSAKTSDQINPSMRNLVETSENNMMISPSPRVMVGITCDDTLKGGHDGIKWQDRNVM